MQLTKEDLLELEDYIESVNNKIGLTPDSYLDIKNAINKYKKLLCSGCGMELDKFGYCTNGCDDSYGYIDL